MGKIYAGQGLQRNVSFSNVKPAQTCRANKKGVLADALLN